MMALALTLQKKEQAKMVVLMWPTIVEAININSTTVLMPPEHELLLATLTKFTLLLGKKI
jgi:hypothetical protein